MKRSLPALLIVACALGACATQPPPRREVAVVRITQSPPTPRVENIPPPPASHFYWVAGHWKWEGGGYVWEGGRWVEPRVDQVYVQAHWSQRGNEWIYAPAHWQTVRGAPGITVIDAPGPPPAPRVEAIAPPPGADFVWINGHWRFDHGQYVWESGRWERHHRGEHWLAAHWVQRGPGWQYVAGRWEVD